MSRPQYGNDMNGSTAGDIIRRARERAEAGLPREDYETFLRRQTATNNSSSNNAASPEIPQRNRPGPGGRFSPERQRQDRPQAPPGLQNKDGQIVLPISRPAPVPQWPLSGAMAGFTPAPDAEPYRPPAGSSPPQRPPRPSHVPSILDASKIQDPTPSFQYQPQQDRPDSEGGITSSVPETPSTLSRPSTLSSVGSIPDFPLPIQAPSPSTVMPARRSVTLGPPPSARRGASSFYSHLSYVSPIPEESPRSRSHTSYASSAAMPEGWGTPSPVESPRYQEVYFDDRMIEEPSISEDTSVHSGPDDDGDEARLVRSASVGRRGRAALVTTAPAAAVREQTAIIGEDTGRPSPRPLQQSPFTDGTGFLDASSNSSNTVPSSRSAGRGSIGAAITDNPPMPPPVVTDLRSVPRRLSGSPQMPQGMDVFGGFNRFSAIRRPPRLDIDAVREAETRGSLTSLPDLIRRATRLAASLDRGKRPASRFDLDDFPPDLYAVNDKLANVDQDSDEYYDDQYRSGLSDMLAAFPPPAQAQSRNGIRRSIRESVLSWPLPPLNGRKNGAGMGAPPAGEAAKYMDPDPANSTPVEYRGASGGSTPESQKKGRRCCGLPMWGFVLIVVLIIVLIAAAVIIPIEFFVVRRNGNNTNNTSTATQQCQNQLTCQNGGTNVVTNGICACICTNGFNGFDCSTSDSAGCTTTTIAGTDNSNINNVTLGNAIPRLLAQAATNFSITLSETAVLSKLNAGNLSCSSQNALVTFDGENSRVGAATDTVAADAAALEVDNLAIVQAEVADDPGAATMAVMAGVSSTTTLIIGSGLISPTTTITITRTITSQWPPPTLTATPSPITTPFSFPTSVSTPTSAPLPSASILPPTVPGFTVTQQVLDFARVGVLFVLQQDSLTEATTAQTNLQSFFSSGVSGLTMAAAANISLSNGNSIDLVNLRVDAGTGLVGGAVGATKREMVDLWAFRT